MWAGFCRETPGLWDTGSGVFKQGNFLSGPGGVAGNNTSLRRGEGLSARGLWGRCWEPEPCTHFSLSFVFFFLKCLVFSSLGECIW